MIIVDPEAKAAAVQDLVDVPRASLALPENRVPSPGINTLNCLLTYYLLT